MKLKIIVVVAALAQGALHAYPTEIFIRNMQPSPIQPIIYLTNGTTILMPIQADGLSRFISTELPGRPFIQKIVLPHAAISTDLTNFSGTTHLIHGVINGREYLEETSIYDSLIPENTPVAPVSAIPAGYPVKIYIQNDSPAPIQPYILLTNEAMQQTTVNSYAVTAVDVTHYQGQPRIKNVALANPSLNLDLLNYGKEPLIKYGVIGGRPFLQEVGIYNSLLGK